MALPEFVDGWSIGDTLGEGAYGEVKRVINRSTGQAVAMKVMNLNNKPDRIRTLARKEVAIHRLLRCPNVIQFYGMRAENQIVYIFLEYAAGGELFDRIEPDIGMDYCEAQKYFRELLAGVKYLHSMGIAHRDIKPENLLLDGKNTLKISDFGFATMYRNRVDGRVRFLESHVGSPAYIAPEVYSDKYLAEPVDIWSSGVVLVAMLTGELPWERAWPQCREYADWKSNANPLDMPWNKLDNMALSLVRKILNPIPGCRYGITEILSHRWMSRKFERVVDTYANREAEVQPSNRLAYSGSVLPPQVSAVEENEVRMCSSQPLPRLEEEEEPYTDSRFSFSQPADVDAMLLSSQVTTNGDTLYVNLVRRMTRFFVSATCECALEALRNLLEKQDDRVKRNDSMLTITTSDKTKNPLVFKVNAFDMVGKTLLDFRRSNGCGLEFKRRFMLIKGELSSIILEGLVSWPIATSVPANPLPEACT